MNGDPDADVPQVHAEEVQLPDVAVSVSMDPVEMPVTMNDSELIAMAVIHQTLKDKSPNEQDRIVRWVAKRLGRNWF